MALYNGGVKEWREIWRARPMTIFSMFGCVCAFGGFVERRSMSSLSGPVSQVLSQVKLIVTAGLLMAIKGQKQSALQRTLLVLLMLSLCCCMIMKDLLEKHRKVREEDLPEAAGRRAGAVATWPSAC